MSDCYAFGKDGTTRGDCWCNCENHLTLVCHPGNDERYGKGTITEPCGWVSAQGEKAVKEW